MLAVQTREDSARRFADEAKLPMLLESGNPFALRPRVLVPREGDVTFTIQATPSEEPPSPASAELERVLERRIKSAMVELQSRPDDPYVLNNAALTLLNGGQIEKAQELLKRALLVSPDLLQAKANFAKSYMLSGKRAEALSIYEDIVGKTPRSILALMNIAQIHILERRLGEAEKVLSDVLRLDPGIAVARSNRGFVRIAQRRFSEAVADLRTATRISIKDATTYNNLGVAYALMNSTKKAEQAFKTALTINPNSEEATKNLARLYLELSKGEPALELLEQYLSRTEDDIEIMNLIARACLLLEKYDLGARHLSRALLIAEERKLQKEQVLLLNNLGVIFQTKGDLVEARELFEKAIKINPRDLLTRQNLAGLLLDLGQMVAAKQQLDDCLEIAPSNSNTASLLGAYYFQLDDYASALRDLERAIQLDPRNVRPYGWLTVVLGDVYGEYAEVTRRLEEARKYQPRNLTILNNLAYSYLMLGETRSARKILDRIDEKEYGYYLMATRGLLLIKEGDIQEGRRWYNLAAKRAPTEDLRKLVGQKKNLELARFYSNEGDQETAKRLLLDALSNKTRDLRYVRHIREMLGAL